MKRIKLIIFLSMLLAQCNCQVEISLDASIKSIDLAAGDIQNIYNDSLLLKIEFEISSQEALNLRLNKTQLNFDNEILSYYESPIFKTVEEYISFCLTNNIHQVIIEKSDGYFENIYNVDSCSDKKINLNNPFYDVLRHESIVIYDNLHNNHTFKTKAISFDDMKKCNSQEKIRFIVICEIFNKGDFIPIAIKSKWYNDFFSK